MTEQSPGWGWSEAKCAGYALAGLIAGDRALAAADAIPAPIAARTRALLAHEGGAEQTPRDRLARQRRVERLLRAVRPELTLQEPVPRRVRALLATRLPRGQQSALDVAAPAAARAVAEDLWPRLYRIARYHLERARSERGEQEP